MSTLRHPCFVAFQVAHPSAYECIAQFVSDYNGLLTFGWTHADVMRAVMTGYNWRAHFNDPRRARRSNKYHHGPYLMRTWHEHYYDQTKAVLIGMDFDEFMACWCSFTAKEVCGKQRTTLQQLVMYVRARRHDFSVSEAHHIVERYFRRFEEYTLLRKKGFSADEVPELLIARKDGMSAQDIKYTAEARRRGAPFDQIKRALSQWPNDVTIAELAIDLRCAARQNDADN
ncbi:MAG TPA: hypothetical protein VLG40_00625 [Candidatus Saccharimonas sp.]|nr:hypothetical protein [Candidatus Saccharimonas sp.]